MYKEGQQSALTYHLSPSVFPGGEGAVVYIQPPQTAKADSAGTLSENTVLPKTSHPSDELAAW